MVDILLPRPLPGAMGEPAKRRPGLALCAGCGGRIQDPFLLRVSPDLEWHVACLKCAECGQPLDETCTCFLRDGKAYCKRDYSRLFGIKCAQCRAAFSSSDLVMRARDHVYHLECFRCAACGRQLLPGDQFCLRERDLLCRADHGPPPDGAAAARGPQSPALPPPGAAHLAEPVPGRPPPPRPPAHKAAEKTTRVRTVLNEKQLHTLRTCYAANPRPDALMKEQLVEMTGLSPRVIRVWFQNKRCKDKKKSILMKQLQQQQHSDKTVSARPLRRRERWEGGPGPVGLGGSRAEAPCARRACRASPGRRWWPAAPSATRAPCRAAPWRSRPTSRPGKRSASSPCRATWSSPPPSSSWSLSPSPAPWARPPAAT
ncbi:insulin gene enhancer protein ISL-2 isoform X3 [Columba livia]|uniref:insulin gene enhancer protein ISL-2 isoform X3 n=1 Tax=Columba livia TaxID=8932 RepID=UPI0031BBA7C8